MDPREQQRCTALKKRIEAIIEEATKRRNAA